MCPSERKKCEMSQVEQATTRRAKLAQKTPEAILAELPAIQEAIRIAAQSTSTPMSEAEIETTARRQVLQNLEDGGHDFPMPQPVFTCDGSEDQLAEMVEIFHIDQIKAALAPGGGGMEGLQAKAKDIMAKRPQINTEPSEPKESESRE
jgi:hypothetical protein